MEESSPILVFEKTWLNGLVFLGSSLFLSAFLYTPFEKKWEYPGFYLVLCLYLPIWLYFLRDLIDRRARLRITSEGIIDRKHSAGLIEWKDVVRVYAYDDRNSSASYLGFEVRDKTKYYSRFSFLRRLQTKFLGRFGFPSIYIRTNKLELKNLELESICVAVLRKGEVPPVSAGSNAVKPEVI